MIVGVSELQQRAERGAEDPGLFGPGSVAWRIHAHQSMLVGGLRALMIQALNPRAMAAMEQHSDYRSDPWGRLMRTGRYIAETTYGDTATAKAAAARVRAIHRRISGVDDFTGQPYRADDPALLLWVHAVEVDSFLTAYRRFGPPLSDSDADRYVDEMRNAAELIGLDRDTVPRDLASLDAYLRDQELVASPAARAALRFLLCPPVAWPGGRYPPLPGSRLLEVPARAAWTVPTAAAVALLPERARRAYGLPNLRPLVPLLRLPLEAFMAAFRAAAPPPPHVIEAKRRMRAPAA
jgi:uncharacterized protein (DUF2236 family)